MNIEQPTPMPLQSIKRNLIVVIIVAVQLSIHSVMMSKEDESIILALPGPKWSLNERDLVANGKQIVLHQFTSKDNTGTTLWDASFVLLKYLEKQSENDNSIWHQKFANSVVVELGSGTGMLGIGLSFLKPPVKHVIVTDKKDCLDNLRNNVLENEKIHADQMSKITVLEMDWFRSKESIQNLKQIVELMEISAIVLADCVWLEHLVQPLVTTIKELLQETEATIFVCNELRSQRIQDSFLKAFSDYPNQYHIRTVQYSDLDPVYSSDKIFVYVISKVST
jgi:hypothetical protein